MSSRRFNFPVEEGHVLMFRRAIGAPNVTSREPVVPVTFVQGGNHFDPQWPFRPDATQELGDATGAVGPVEDVRHAEEHIEIIRPLRVGDRLTAVRADGPTWTKVNSRRQTLEFRTTLTDYLDETGNAVVRTRSVGVVVTAPLEGGEDR